MRPLDPNILAALDWLPVTETARPADTASDTWEVAYTVNGPTIIQSWTARPWTPEELADQLAGIERDADRQAVVEDALVWLKADALQAAARVAQIETVLGLIGNQITQVQGFTFNGTNVTQINNQLNSSLKPQLVSVLQRLQQVGGQLQELNVARDRHGDALVWLARYVMSDY